MKDYYSNKNVIIVSGIFLALMVAMIALGISNPLSWVVFVIAWFVIEWVVAYR